MITFRTIRSVGKKGVMAYNEPTSLGLLSKSSKKGGRRQCASASHRYLTGRPGARRTLKNSPAPSGAPSTISSMPHFAVPTLSLVRPPRKGDLTAATAPKADCLCRPVIALHHVSVDPRTKDSNGTRGAYIWPEKELNLAWLATNRFHKPDGGSITVIEKVEPAASCNRPHGPPEKLSKQGKAVNDANPEVNVGMSVVSLSGVRAEPVAIASDKKLAVLKASLAYPNEAPVSASFQKTIRRMEPIIRIGSSIQVTGRGGARCLGSSFFRPCRNIQPRRRSTQHAKAWR